MKRFWICVISAALMLSMTGCSGKAAEEQFFAMDTVIRLTAYGKKAEQAVNLGEECITEMENILSATLEDSDVSAINRAGGEMTQVREETARLVEAAKQYTAATDGAFDITIAPVVTAWGFTTDSHQVPDEVTLERLLQVVDSSAMEAAQKNDSWYVACGENQIIDLGGIAKGYVSDRMADIFAENGITGGTAALGGNVLAWGTKEDGSRWNVGVQDPAKPNDAAALVGIVALENAFAVTSGGYQRYFEENGETYHHIIDPATGYPADSGLVSVTVVADCHTESLEGKPGSGTMCDALSTALFVMGEEKALEFRSGSEYDFDLVLVTADGRVVVTEGVAEAFAFNEESGYLYEIVS